MGNDPVRPVEIDELPPIPELSEQDWLDNLPSFVDDVFSREYQGLLRWVDGSAVAYRNSDIRSLMVKAEATNTPTAPSARPLSETLGRPAKEWEWFLGANVFTMVPPLHAPARQLLARQLTRNRMAEYGALAEQVVREISSEAFAVQELDYQRDYAGNIAARFWGNVFGFNPEEQEALQQLADRVTPGLSIEYSVEEAEDVNRAAGEYMQLCSDAIMRELKRGANTVLNEMAEEFEAIDLPDRPRNLGDNLAAAMYDGLHTMKVGLTNVAYALLTHPEAKEELDADTSLISSAVEEGWRLNSPTGFTQRYTAAEIVHDGVRIPKDTPITMIWSVGNRDPEVFPEPNVFRLDRKAKGIITFGGGFHICPGRHVSWLMAEAALRVWCEDGFDISLNRPAEWGPTSFLVQLNSVPVTISPASASS
jgi:cytochrome P450